MLLEEGLGVIESPPIPREVQIEIEAPPTADDFESDGRLARVAGAEQEDRRLPIEGALHLLEGAARDHAFPASVIRSGREVGGGCMSRPVWN